MHAASAEVPEEDADAAGPSGGGVLIEGITHRILAFLFLERYRNGRTLSDGLRRFFYSFDAYATLVIWKVHRPCCSGARTDRCAQSPQ